MNGITRKEPIIIIGIIAAAIIAVLEGLAAGQLLDIEVSEEAIKIIQAVVAIAAILLGRMSVFSPATHDADVDTALHAPVPEDGDGPTDTS